MKKLIAGLITASVLFCYPFLAVAADSMPDNQLEITQEYVTTNSDFAGQYDKDFDTSIEQDGEKWNLLQVSYTVSKETALERLKPIRHIVTYDDLYEMRVNVPKELTIIEDDNEVTVRLTNVEYTPKMITGRRHTVLSHTDYGLQVDTPNPAATMTVDYYDEQSKQTIKVELPFKELVELDGYSWRSDFSLPIKVSIYEAQFYAISDKLIPYNEKAPAIQGTEKEILLSAGLDPEKYVIDKAVWVGDPYQTGETTSRDALATGRRYAASYQAVYEGEIALPDAPGYIAAVTYEGESTIHSGKTEYTVTAKALYQRDDTAFITTVALSISIGVLILLSAVVILLVLLAKRRKRKVEPKKAEKSQP